MIPRLLDLLIPPGALRWGRLTMEPPSWHTAMFLARCRRFGRWWTRNQRSTAQGLAGVHGMADAPLVIPAALPPIRLPDRGIHDFGPAVERLLATMGDPTETSTRVDTDGPYATGGAIPSGGARVVTTDDGPIVRPADRRIR